MPGPARGAAAGALATLFMSAVMFAAKRAGLMGTMPPEKITARLLRRLGWRHPDRTVQDAIASGLHVAFGAAGGALYGGIRRGLKVPGPSVVTGMLFGTAVWLVSYAGWVPALGIMAPPNRDRPGRPESMLVAHLVFGAVLGILVGGSERGRAARPVPARRIRRRAARSR